MHATPTSPTDFVNPPVRKRVLDPVRRVSEMIFGLLMALTFIGALNVASAGQQEVRTMMFAAIGCNLAWGLTDALMYLLATFTERTRKRTLVTRLKSVSAAEGSLLLLEALPPSLAEAVGRHGVEGLRQALIHIPDSAQGPRLGVADAQTAAGVFLVVVLSTFPVVLPFIFVDELATAMRFSNAIALVMLFGGGWSLAKYSGASPWQMGSLLALLGSALTAAVIALGG
ncbi:hypothetical protein VVD49_12680 [Uliginosibacterium sp. H3]|uniref:VIT family protein n=1 Tax=Uliginosibacterium silvisoli TaxID=3114758 RepID=A0ABU6K4N7_9RHOO|nr:hypothetical protein [Uliginosibacterium sp. H3]